MRTSRTHLLVAAIFALAGCERARAAPEPSPAAPGERAFTFVADADGWVGEEQPADSHGSARELRSDAWPVQWAYLRFTVAGVTASGAPLARATLRLFALDGTLRAPSLHAAGVEWSEQSLSWSTRPLLASDRVHGPRTVRGGEWFDYDVTALVKGDGPVAFALVPESTDGLVIASRETEHAPRLIVSTRTDLCGDRVCGKGESCSTCPQDCGACGPAVAPRPEQGVGQRLKASLANGWSALWSRRPPERGGAAPERREVRREEAARADAVAASVPLPGAGAEGTQDPAGPATAAVAALPSVARTDGAVSADASGPVQVASASAPAEQVSVEATRAPVRLVPVADAYVDQTAPDRNTASSRRLLVDGAPQRRAYLRFAVPRLQGKVATATLRLFVLEGAEVGPTLYATRSQSWTERDLTWNTRPATRGEPIGDRRAVSAGSWVEFDVTPLVRSGRAVEFVVIPTSADGLELGARESSHPPELVLAVEDAVSPVAATGRDAARGR